MLITARGESAKKDERGNFLTMTINKR